MKVQLGEIERYICACRISLETVLSRDCILVGLISNGDTRDVDDGKNVIWKCNFAFLLSFLDYFKSLDLKNAHYPWNFIDKSNLEIERKKRKFVVKWSRFLF